jgi:hypothetical protein
MSCSTRRNKFLGNGRKKQWLKGGGGGDSGGAEAFVKSLELHSISGSEEYDSELTGVGCWCLTVTS